MSKNHEANEGQGTSIDQAAVDALLAEGAVEAMVRSGRIPSVMYASSAGAYSVDMALCVVPPDGTQAGDSIAYGAGGQGCNDMGIQEFRAPDGSSRGLGKLLTLNLDQAGDIQTRVDNTLAEMGHSDEMA